MNTWFASTKKAVRSLAKKRWSHNGKGFTITEILMAVLIMTLIATFALPVYTTAVRKNRERTVINNLYALQSASLIYKARNGNFWDTADAWETTLATINATLGTEVSDPDGIVAYSYIYELTGGSDTYAVRGDWTENGDRTVVEIRETGGRVVNGPCCNAVLADYCLLVPDC